jgi:hypothetical protein
MLHHVVWYILTNISEEVLGDTLMTEAVNTSEKSVYIYQTTWCNIPEDIHLHVKEHKH